MLRRCAALRNFFPFGKRRGPTNPEVYRAVPYTNDCANAPSEPVGFQHVRRHELSHKCRFCQFRWRFDRLSVQCPANAQHNQIEHGLHHTWVWEHQQPYNWYAQLKTGYWPQIGAELSAEKSNSSKHNRERRGAGCTTRVRTRHAWRTGVARSVSNIGSRNHTWKTYFPYPT
jgi:hypothetical protein